MPFWGGGKKKKIEGINNSIDTKDQEIEELQKELRSLRLEVKLCGEDTQRMQQQIASESKDQAQATEKTTRLSRVIEDAQFELDKLRQQVVAAKLLGDRAREEKGGLLDEEVKANVALEGQREEVEASAAAAQEKAAVLQAERVQQDVEQKRWLVAAQANEELKKQLAASQEQHDQAVMQREEARVAWSTAKEEVFDLKLDSHKLQTEHRDSEDTLAGSVKQREALEKEIADLESRHGVILAAQEELAERHRNRAGALKTVRDDFEKKQAGLTANLQDFERTFEKVKADRHKTFTTNAAVRDSQANTMPAYFQLPQI